MDFFDLLKEMRKGTPDVKKAAKAMKILGWACIAGALWNFIIYFLAPFDEIPFNLPESYPYIALVSLSVIGFIFLRASKGIIEMAPWGKRMGQLAVLLLIIIIPIFMVHMFSTTDFPLFSENLSPIFIIVLIIFSAQFLLPAYFGIRYLGRLPINTSPSKYAPADLKNTQNKTLPQSASNFKDALFPFGIFGTFALLLIIPILGFLIIEKSFGPDTTASMFFPFFIFIFVAPVVYNYISSPFQMDRTPVDTFTGGGAINLFSGTWPFFRLLVYKDGIEIRIMFHRYFIPYSELGELPEKVGFFSRGILIKSNLSGVPAGIRFHAFGTKRVLSKINACKNEYKGNMYMGH